MISRMLTADIDAVVTAAIGFLALVLFARGDSIAAGGTGGNGMLAPCPSSPMRQEQQT